MSKVIRLASPTGRNTRANRLDIGPHELYFSYETCIAYSGPVEGTIRIANSWGPTTGRHFKELGVDKFQVLSDREFNERVAAALGVGQ